MMDAFERAAQREREEKLRQRDELMRTGFRVHLGVYLAVQVLLVAVWWFTSDGGQVMPWFIFPALGWGIGVVAHWMVARSRRRPAEAPRGEAAL